jgi:ubiquinone/menaquinone biosynthesis C-methylase UbiE
MVTVSLKEIFWNLEKGSTKWSGYFDVYEKHLNKFIGKSPRILEIGVLGGGSIEMWLKYFGKDTSVIGIDINPECLQYKYDGDAQIVMGDQSSPEFWKQFAEENGTFDIIIDDGGHTMNQQITTLNSMFPHLNDGGVFAVEDTHTSYWQNWGGGFKEPQTFLEHAKKVTDSMNQQHFQGNNYLLPQTLERYKGLNSVSFYNSVVVFEKEAYKEFGITDNKTLTGRNL